jgi:hypothetical protein
VVIAKLYLSMRRNGILKTEPSRWQSESDVQQTMAALLVLSLSLSLSLPPHCHGSSQGSSYLNPPVLINIRVNRVAQRLQGNTEKQTGDGSSPNIMIRSKRMRWTGHVARMGVTRNAYRILVGKSEGKRPLGTRRWVDNSNIGLKSDRMDWIHLAQDRVQLSTIVNTVVKHSGYIKCWEILGWLHSWQLLKKGSAP